MHTYVRTYINYYRCVFDRFHGESVCFLDSDSSKRGLNPLENSLLSVLMSGLQCDSLTGIVVTLSLLAFAQRRKNGVLVRQV